MGVQEKSIAIVVLANVNTINIVNSDANRDICKQVGLVQWRQKKPTIEDAGGSHSFFFEADGPL